MPLLLITKAAFPSCSKMVALEVLENFIVFYYQKQHLEAFFKKAVFYKKLSNFTEKRLCWSLFLINLQAWRPATLLKRGCNRTSANGCFYMMQSIRGKFILWNAPLL